MKLAIELPAVSRARSATTMSLSTLFAGLWILPPAYLPFAEVNAQHVLVGLAIPYGAGYVSLVLADRRAQRDLKRVRHQTEPERQVDDGPPPQPVSAGRVIEGEILR